MSTAPPLSPTSIAPPLPATSDGRERLLAQALLGGAPVFRDVPDADLVALWRCLRKEELRAGTVLFRRGDAGDRLYLVKTGKLELRLGIAPEGCALRSLGPGDLFGEMAVLTGAPRSADAVAVEDSVLWALDRADFDRLSEVSIPLLRALSRDLCRRLALTTLQLEELEPRTATRRVGGDSRSGPDGAPATKGARPALLGALTAREREVLVLLTRGFSNRQIADSLVVSERTAAAHVGNILSKLGLTSRSQVIVWAIEHAQGAPRAA